MENRIRYATREEAEAIKATAMQDEDKIARGCCDETKNFRY